MGEGECRKRHAEAPFHAGGGVVAVNDAARGQLRIAERLAQDMGAHALVTGDVVGQVASQTLENIAAVDNASAMPILRPLVGFDKEEITREAQQLGTYEISIIPDEDCCTLFTPRLPATRAGREAVEHAEARLDVAGLVDAAVAAAVIETFKFPVIRSTSSDVGAGFSRPMDVG